MNDYLSNLVGKALNRLPVVRPQRAPLFAPSPYVEGAFGASPLPTPATGESQAEETSPDAPPDASGARPTTSTFRRDADETQSRHARGRERRPATHPEGFAAREAETRARRGTEVDDDSQAPLAPRRTPEEPHTRDAPAPRSEGRAPTEASAPRPRARHDDDERPSPHDDDVVENLAPTHAAARATEAAVADLRRRVDGDERGAEELERELARLRAGVRGLFGGDSSRAFAPPASSQTVESAADRIRRRAASRDDAHAPATPHVKPRAVVPAPHVQPVAAAHAPRTPTHAGSEAAPAEPTIQVTIGRIEVRATPQPSTPRRSPAPAPRQSLEEYLQRRSGGGR